MPRKSIAAIIPAAGNGVRFGGKKQFALINGVVVLKAALTALQSAYPFDEFIIGAAEEDMAFIDTLDLGSNIIFSPGGADRSTTVINALNRSKCDFAAIHDAVRPFVSKEIVRNTIDKALSDGAAICGVFAVDTVKLVADSKVAATLDRERVFLSHTPQVFEREKLLCALESALKSGERLTDEASAYELAGFPVSITLSDKRNIKITYPEDI
ncbi:MAG: 2-C-methyl-D-erythritol 4-phosphate cytidylyltransferase [Deferribacteraceae bacterium]|jgi:2-C-methyl-D-erythritol 4-phosphate cytidylyltransferase|nr:2-C-methyl-D-erythritol 4-phosphate cytidylyltransferase [Deferribacteraceae bacterium]